MNDVRFRVDYLKTYILGAAYILGAGPCSFKVNNQHISLLIIVIDYFNYL